MMRMTYRPQVGVLPERHSVHSGITYNRLVLGAGQGRPIQWGLNENQGEALLSCGSPLVLRPIEVNVTLGVQAPKAPVRLKTAIKEEAIKEEASE